MFDPSHQLPELLETSNEGNILAEPKNIVSTKIQQLWNKIKNFFYKIKILSHGWGYMGEKIII